VCVYRVDPRDVVLCVCVTCYDSRFWLCVCAVCVCVCVCVCVLYVRLWQRLRDDMCTCVVFICHVYMCVRVRVHVLCAFDVYVSMCTYVCS
jgi:hypothetical protein